MGYGVNSMRGDVLGGIGSAKGQGASDWKTHISLLMEVTLYTPIEHHLGVQVVEETLDGSDPTRVRVRVRLVVSRLADDVEEPWVEIVEASVRSDGGSCERDERTCRQGVLGCPLRRWRFVVVSAVHEERVGCRSRMRGDVTRPSLPAEGDGRELSEAIGIHRACASDVISTAMGWNPTRLTDRLAKSVAVQQATLILGITRIWLQETVSALHAASRERDHSLIASRMRLFNPRRHTKCRSSSSRPVKSSAQT